MFLPFDVYKCIIALFLLWIWLMIRIAKKLGFMTGRVVKVFTKAGIGSSSESKNRVFVVFFRKNEYFL